MRTSGAFRTRSVTFIDKDWVLIAISLALIPLALSLRSVKLGRGGMAMAH